MTDEYENKYVVCKKCGVNYSTLTKHRCFVQDEAPPPPESEGGPDDNRDAGDGKPEQGDGQGEQPEQGEGQGEQGEGEQEAEGEGEGEGEGDGEQEREAPEPQKPEPETPPVAVVVTVLKFAALTADCAKNASIEVTLNEDGLLVYGNNGDETATATIPWTEFEKRSTIDGEFYVKGVIDEVDRSLADKSSDERKLADLVAEAKAKKAKQEAAKAEKAEAEAPKEAPKPGKRKAA
jgi:hypothetical protein